MPSTQNKRRDFLLALALLSAGAALIYYPSQIAQAARQGLQLCFDVIIPSLFPFFVLSSLVVELGLVQYLARAAEGLMWPLFRVGGAGACALALGFVGGYPIGARTAIDLYKKGLCSKTETQRLLAFCNNSGPAFLFGVVGAGVFKSNLIGLALYASHMVAALCTGFLFRFYGSKAPRMGHRSSTPQFQSIHLSTAFTISIRNAFAAVWNICAFVLFFTVIIRLLSLCGIMSTAARVLSVLLPITPNAAHRLLTGLLEVSSGVTALAGEGTLTEQLSIASFILGWAGLSVHCQVFSFLDDTDLSSGTYLIGKALHGIFAGLLTWILIRRFPLSIPASSPLFTGSFFLSSTSCVLASFIAVTWLSILFLLCTVRYKKRAGKRMRHEL